MVSSSNTSNWLKRSHSDSDDEEYSEEAGFLTQDCLYSPTSNESNSYSSARKKRRGLIEKRRRDRINRSLNDLKNLIPSANERQAAAKLEKSEVLSMAVDHIRALQLKESSSPQALALDYRTIGYRECINEVITYLVNIEGLGPADPLHSRLIGHLNHQSAALEQNPYYFMGQATPPHPSSSASQPSQPSQPCYDQPVICKPEPPSPTYINQQNCYSYSSPPVSQQPVPYEQSNSQFSSPAVNQATHGQSMQYYFSPPSSWV